MQSVRRIIAWQRSMDLMVDIYRLSRGFPKEELFVLTTQLRRSILSVPSNIAEGNERDTLADRRHFLTIARGSISEVDTQLEAAARLGFATTAELAGPVSELDQISRMLTVMKRNVRARPNPD